MRENEPSPVTPAASERGITDAIDIPAGGCIYRQDDPGVEVFIIDIGEVDLVERREGEDRAVARLGPGDFFGEAAVCGAPRREESALARSACRLLPIGRDLFPEVLRAEPGIAIVMLERLSRRAREIQARGVPLFVPTEAPEPEVDNPPSTPTLVHVESGRRFDLSDDPETTVGRSGSAVEPDIDLSDLDPHSTVSRAHAVIVRGPGGFHVIESKPSTNGTFVDGERISAGVEVPLPTGCMLTLGSVQMKLETS